MIHFFHQPLGMDIGEREALCRQQWSMQLRFVEGVQHGDRPEFLQGLALGIARLDAELRTN